MGFIEDVYAALAAWNDNVRAEYEHITFDIPSSEDDPIIYWGA